MYDNNFFKLVKLINQKHLKRQKFNLFSVLRSDSDEVRLHSRFLGELLDPNGSHELGTTLANNLFSQTKLNFRASSKTKLAIEYKNIDLFLCDGDNALIIENKIFADDQHQQIRRYYDIAKSEGYKQIEIVYLTPSGHSPSDNSTNGLPENIKKQIRLLSYSSDIKEWIRGCTALSAENPALRESFIQYNQVIENITGQTMTNAHMDDLKDLLNPNTNPDNFTEFHNLVEAHKHIVVGLFADTWKGIRDLSADKFGPALAKSSLSDEEIVNKCHQFIEKRKSSRFFGLFFHYRDGLTLSVEMQTQKIIVGVAMEGGDESLHNAAQLATSASGGMNSENWPRYRNVIPSVNYRDPTKGDLELLADKEARNRIAEDAVEQLLKLKQQLDENLPRLLEKQL